MGGQRIDMIGVQMKLKRSRVFQELAHYRIQSIRLFDDDIQHVSTGVRDVFALKILSSPLDASERIANFVREAC